MANDYWSKFIPTKEELERHKEEAIKFIAHVANVDVEDVENFLNETKDNVDAFSEEVKKNSKEIFTSIKEDVEDVIESLSNDRENDSQSNESTKTDFETLVCWKVLAENIYSRLLVKENFEEAVDDLFRLNEVIVKSNSTLSGVANTMIQTMKELVEYEITRFEFVDFVHDEFIPKLKAECNNAKKEFLLNCIQ